MAYIDEERRRAWLRALRQFKYGVRVRAKLGLLQKICVEVHTERGLAKHWDAPDWDDPRWLNLLYLSILRQEFPDVLLRGFVQSAKVSFFAMHIPPTAEGAIDEMNAVCQKHSRKLRTMFGVFKKGTPHGNHEKATKEVPTKGSNTQSDGVCHGGNDPCSGP